MTIYFYFNLILFFLLGIFMSTGGIRLNNWRYYAILATVILLMLNYMKL